MAGHSKWANIKHRKAKEDKRKGKVFTKLIREITVSARLGSDDPNSNPRLRAAIDAAYAENMTKDTIERAIKRGAGGLEGDQVEEIMYEGYGPFGVAVLVECLSDNRNRTVGLVRHAFTKCGGNLGTNGSVAYLFNKKGLMVFAPGCDEDKLMEAALEIGVEDFLVNEDGSIEIITEWESFEQVKAQLLAQHFKAENAEITFLPSTQVVLEKEAAEKMLQLQEMLEDLDDVQAVYSNADIPEEFFAE